jgi:hypothetical protein
LCFGVLLLIVVCCAALLLQCRRFVQWVRHWFVLRHLAPSFCFVRHSKHPAWLLLLQKCCCVVYCCCCSVVVGVESPCETPSLRSFKDASLVRSLASGFLILFRLALKASFMIITTPTMLLFVYCCCNRVVVGVESRHGVQASRAPRFCRSFNAVFISVYFF